MVYYEVILQGIKLGKQTAYRKANSLRTNHASTADYKETGDHGFRQREQKMAVRATTNNTVCTIDVYTWQGKRWDNWCIWLHRQRVR